VVLYSRVPDGFCEPSDDHLNQEKEIEWEPFVKERVESVMAKRGGSLLLIVHCLQLTIVRYKRG